MTDVLISGGGIAGSTLAILLGRRGFSVKLFEQSQFPREKACGEGLMPAGLSVLERMGLKEAVGGAPFLGVKYHFGSRKLEGRFPVSEGFPSTGRGQRRSYLDALLLRTAELTPGVATYRGARVQRVLVKSGRVVGLQVEGVEQRANIVVAADGLHSLIRRELGLSVKSKRQRLGVRGHFRLADDQPLFNWVEIFVFPGYELYVTPLPDRQVTVAVLADAQAVSHPLKEAFRSCIRSEPSLVRRLEGAQAISAPMGAFPLAARARSGVVPGAVLLGDAAGSLDPITGGGMTHALLTAQLLAECFQSGTEESWLWKFERRRLNLLRKYRVLTRVVLSLAEHPRWAPVVLSSLQFAPWLFAHLVGVTAGVHGLLGGRVTAGGTLGSADSRSPV